MSKQGVPSLGRRPRTAAVLIAGGALAGVLSRCTSRPSVQPVNPWGGWTNEPPAYEVTKSQTVNPFTRPGCRIALEAMTHEGLMVGKKPVAQYEHEKDETVAASFEQDLDDANRRFADALKEGAPEPFAPNGAADNTFVMRPAMTEWEPGFKVSAATPSLAAVSRDAEMTVVVDVVDPAGSVLDEISVTATTPVHEDPPIDVTVVHTGGATLRMHELAARLGKQVSRYVHDRWSCVGR